MPKTVKANITKNETAAEYQRIRQYVIDQVLLAGRERKRLASIRELAALFGVSIATIQWALRELIEDEFITAEKGVGLFTNPAKAWLSEPAQVIGVLTADGRQVYFERFLWNLLASVGKSVTRAEKLLYNINLFYAKHKTSVEFEHAQLAGVVWIAPNFAPSDVTESFFKSLNVPVVTIAHHRPGCSCFQFDEELEGYEIGKKLIELDKTNPVVAAKDSEMPQLRGLRRAFDEAGLRLNEKLILYRHEGTLEKLRTIIDLMGDPEAIYAMGGMLYAITPILREKKVDFDRCLLIGEEVVWKPDFRGWQVGQDFDALAELAVQQLLAEIGGAPRRDQMSPRIITPIS
ncbi:MAG: GntR family transcriptional regulator [Victivallaceae bacterium]|nr:GntR family transcriptional regulator [Victivallaceae bacterium]